MTATRGNRSVVSKRIRVVTRAMRTATCGYASSVFMHALVSQPNEHARIHLEHVPRLLPKTVPGRQIRQAPYIPSRSTHQAAPTGNQSPYALSVYINL